MNDRLLTERIRAEMLNAGMDLVGFGPVERWRNAPYLLSPQAILPEAKTVIVGAVYILDTWMELGGEPTPQDHGPGGWMDQNALLDRTAYRVARLLSDAGHATIAVASSNIWRYREYEGIPSLFAPDLSHIHAAVAAGPGELGKSGALLTPEHGPHQRLICVVTDAELPAETVVAPGAVCRNGAICQERCPMDALPERNVNLSIDGVTVACPLVDRNRCDWAKRYSLHPDEGPALIGTQTPVPTPEGEVTITAIAAACAAKDPVMKHRTCILEPCLRHCPAGRGGAARAGTAEPTP